MRVRAEVADTLAARAPVHHQPRVFLVERHSEHRIRLVVAVAHVESRVELLDPVVLELQRLDLGADHSPLDAGRGGHHLPGPGHQGGDVGKVGRHPAAQALGLADVNPPPVRITEAVDARLDGNRPRGRPVRRWIGHVPRLVPGARGPARTRAGSGTRARGPGPSRPPPAPCPPTESPSAGHTRRQAGRHAPTARPSEKRRRPRRARR